MQPEVLVPLLIGLMGIAHEIVKMFRDFIKRDADETKNLYEEQKRLQKRVAELELEKDRLLFLIDRLEDKKEL